MDVRCPICRDTVRDPQYSRSRHVACKGCIDTMFASAGGNDPVSPNTRTAMTSRDYYGPMYTDAADSACACAAAAGAGNTVRVVMLADSSGSMSGSSANSTAEAAPSRISLMIHFIKMLSEAFGRDGLAVMSFSDSCNSINIADIDTLRPSGGTDMVLALATAVSLHGTDPAFIMFTDGEPAAGTEAQTVAAFRAFGPALKLHVVGFGPSLNSAVMRELSANGTNTYINSVATAPIMIASLAAFLIAPRRAVLSTEDSDLRDQFVASLGNIIAHRAIVADLVAMLRFHRPSPYCLALLEDVESDDIVLGQIGKAVTEPWGAYYLDAILSAHRQGYAMSDLESSLRFYATDEFITVRDVAMATMRRTPYVPVMATDHGARTRGAVARSTSSFTQDRGGCFAGDATVTDGFGNRTRIDQLAIGARVVAFDADDAVCVGTVQRIVKYIHGGNITLYGGFITAYHPFASEWRPCSRYVFPCDFFAESTITTRPVYNILLEKGPVGVLVDAPDGAPRSYHCLTFGHNIQDDAVASHPYFGTDRVRDEIMAQPIVNGRVHANLPTRDESRLVKSMFNV